jgi:magnesium transporter
MSREVEASALHGARDMGVSGVTAAMFREGRLVDRGGIEDSMPPFGSSEFIWIEVRDPTDGDFELLQDRFQLHSLAVKDSMTPTHVPKVDLYEDQIFVVLKWARLEADEIRYDEVEAFLSGSHIITVQHGKDEDFDAGWEKIRAGLAASRVQPDFILHSIMDFIVDGYFPVVQMIEEEVLLMEQQILDGFLEREEITRLFRLRREAIRFQHMLTRMSDVCGKLVNLEVPGVRAEARPYFRDVHDHLVHLSSMVSRLVDVIRGVFEASNLLEQQRQGTITRQLAAWAAILAVPTAIAGVYGMNFPNMPELALPHAYPIVLGVMASFSIGLYVRFKILRWL